MAAGRRRAVTAHHRRGAYAEDRTAAALGGERVKNRPRKQRAPDVWAVRLPSGEFLQPECKSRRRGTKLVEAALVQAAGYTPSAIPVAVISARGGRPIACVYLDDFARLVGVKELEQWKQLALLGSPHAG
jgi:hypothetical protein